MKRELRTDGLTHRQSSILFLGLERRTVLNKPVVIVGGGIAGLTVSHALCENGFPSVVVEKSNHVGGRVRDWACMATHRCLRCFCCAVEDLAHDVTTASSVDIILGSELSGVIRCGQSLEQVRVKSVASGHEELLDASALVIATGFEPYNPKEKLLLGYGRFEGVFTLIDVDTFLREDKLFRFTSGIQEPLRVAFFQCVGSRDKTIGADYCSQYCCKGALRMALRLLENNSDWEITVFYIDLQIAGKLAGWLLSEAKERGIRLVQGVPGEIVEVADNMLQVTREDNGSNIREEFHRVILSIGQRPPSAASRIASLCGVHLDDFGFLAPTSFFDTSRTNVAGVYVAGTCSGPKDIENTITHAGQTAAAIITDLKNEPRV